MLVEVLAQRLQQRRIFRETFHQDLARAIQRCLCVGYAGVVAVGSGEGRLQILRGFIFRIERGIGEQRVGQFRQAGFGGNLRLGAALRLVRQVQVFQTRLVFRMGDRIQQFRRHLALFVD